MAQVIHRLDEVCVVTMGQAPRGEAYNSTGTGWPLIAGAGDFSNGQPQAKKFTTEASKLSAQGDIVLGIRASIGAKVLSDRVYCLGRGVAGLRAGSVLDAGYLWHWLTHAAPVLSAKGKGATFKQVNKQDIGEMPIALPPLEEQRRIAAILDQADALRVKRREALAYLDDLTQAIFLDMFGDPETNQRRLPIRRLRDLAEIGTGSTPSRSNSANYGGQIPWVKTGEVNGGVISETEEYLTDAGMRSSRCRVYPSGSILIAMYGQGKTRGQTASLGIPAATNQACAVLIPNPEYEPSFLSAQLQMAYVRLRAMARGGNQANLNLQIVGDFPVLVPPLCDQTTFARHIERISALRRLEHATRFDDLFTSLQDRAFNDEL